MRTIAAALALPALLACNEPAGTTDVEIPADQLPPAARVLDLAKYDLPLELTLPDAQTAGGASPQMGWNEEEGWFGVKVGEHFSLHITEEPGDIPRLKGDLDRDLLRKHTVLIDKPDLLVFRSEFPDDPTLVQLHFYQVIMAGDRSFVVESDPEGRFDQADVDRMRMAVNAKGPA